MTIVTLPYRTELSAGQPEDVGMVLADMDAILAVLNGDIRNDNIHAAAAIAPTKLALPGGVVTYLRADGTFATPAGGAEADAAYLSSSGLVNVTATTAATANTIITAPAFTAVAQPYWIEFFCGRVAPDPNGRQVIFTLWLDGVDAGSFGSVKNVGSGGITVTMDAPVILRRKVTPAAGSRTYSIRAYHLGGGGTSVVDGAYGPMYVRIVKGV